VQADVARADQVRAMVDVPIADYETMFAINVRGTFLCTQHALRPMVAARYGRIINFSTQLVRASVGTGGCAAYAATKGAVEAFTRAMATSSGLTASPSTPSRPAELTPT
jgi:3-oxoacyl-[acyl-carrier protein] reductase